MKKNGLMMNSMIPKNKFFTMHYYTCLFLILISYSCKTKNTTLVKTDESSFKTEENHPDYYINMYGDTIVRWSKSESEWKEILSPQEYYVLREKGTERSFSGELLKLETEGLYTCKACQLPLFASKHKFDSGTGWPSFFNVLDKKAILEETDHLLGYPRTEVMCGRCKSHLGHVFPDGPQPTGLRYCINSIALGFVKTEF